MRLTRSLATAFLGMGFALAIVLTPLQAKAGPESYRLAWLQNAPPSAPFYKAFLEALRALGYSEGGNIEIVIRSAQGNMERLPELARELVTLKPDAILTGGDQGLRAVKDASVNTPIIAVVCDPLGALVASIARPGGRATGLTCLSSELSGKRLQLLKELVPHLARVAVLYNPGDPHKADEFHQMQDASKRLDISVKAFEASSPDEIVKTFDRMKAEQIEAAIILTDAFMVVQQKRLAELAMQLKMPAMFGFREFADDGGLVSYGASLQQTYRRAAAYVDKVLHGTDPGSIPIEEPTRFEMVVNHKTARLLGLAVPPSILARADDVIE